MSATDTHSLRLQQLQAEIKSALASLFTVNQESTRQFQTGTYGIMYAAGTKRIKSILGVEREVLILSNTYADQQPRSIQFANKIIADSSGRLESNVCVVVHTDPRGNAKLKRWGREKAIAVLPLYTSDLILPRGQELERLLSYEFFSQDPFDVTGPVANDSQFFGRRTEAQELARKLQKGQIRSCFGIRKIGKTSVLHRVLLEIKENYEAVTVFIDCQRDDVFALNASSLLHSISRTLQILKQSGKNYAEVDAFATAASVSESAKSFQSTLEHFDVPVLLAFDEIDYITPGNSAAPHWREGFVEFWRNVRAAYHAAERADRKVSLLISGVSSRWFTVESVDGVENAALAFVPEEYLSPLPRGAANAMIRNLGSVAGLRFDDPAADSIASFCSDMPFWIRKACSFLHARIEVNMRPINLGKNDVLSAMQDFGRDEGAALAHVALQHLFRVYLELRDPAVKMMSGEVTAPAIKRTLCRYGVANANGAVSGPMMESALRQIVTESSAVDAVAVRNDEAPLTPLSEWAEELATISIRRNVLERTLRSFVINFLRVKSLSGKGDNAKALLLACLQERRRLELEPFNLEVIAEKLLWSELVVIIGKHWEMFERIFGDKAAFNQNSSIINDRPDAHAKSLDPADIALHRRSLQWIEERIARV